VRLRDLPESTRWLIGFLVTIVLGVPSVIGLAVALGWIPLGRDNGPIPPTPPTSLTTPPTPPTTPPVSVPPPNSMQLAAVLLRSGDVANSYRASGRPTLLDPAGAVVCSGVRLPAPPLAVPDEFRAYFVGDKYTIYASGATVMGRAAAIAFMESLREAVQRCGHQVREDSDSLGQEVIRYVPVNFEPAEASSPSNQLASPTDVILGEDDKIFRDNVVFRRGCVVIQVGTQTLDGNHSSVIDRLAETISSRAVSFDRC
jgi:hypothetical protein